MDTIIKDISTKAEKVESRVLKFVGSDESVDKIGDKIMVDGWNLKDYKTNPVVLFAHNRAGKPVARTKRVWVDKNTKQLLFNIEFPESDISSEGDSLYRLYKAGYMQATSVGFMPNHAKIEYPENKSGKGPYRIFHEQSLSEISLVSVPANARALLTSKSMDEAINKEIICKEEIDELLAMLDTEEKVEDKDETIIKLECKIAELELQIDDDDIYTKLFNEYVMKDDTEESLYDSLINDLK